MNELLLTINNYTCRASNNKDIIDFPEYSVCSIYVNINPVLVEK